MAVMQRLRSLRGLLKEFTEFASANKAWWIVPIVVVLLLVAGIISLGGGATPLIYTLF
jgi:hypothetical protein